MCSLAGMAATPLPNTAFPHAGPEGTIHQKSYVLNGDCAGLRLIACDKSDGLGGSMPSQRLGK